MLCNSQNPESFSEQNVLFLLPVNNTNVNIETSLAKIVFTTVDVIMQMLRVNPVSLIHSPLQYCLFNSDVQLPFHYFTEEIEPWHALKSSSF